MSRIISLDPPPLLHQEGRILTFDDWSRDAARASRFRPSPAVRAARAARMFDGPFYLDQRTPFISADCASVTLATTDKALYAVKDFPVLGSGYFNQFIGKAIAIWMFGRITTVLTPGNLTADVYFGNGADANGVLAQASGALALTASRTNDVWRAELICRTRALGTTGTIFVTGKFELSVTVMASTLQPMLIPATAPATSGALDLTTAGIISVQWKRSGSTVETAQVHELAVIALN